jgi:hypothetical protein
MISSITDNFVKIKEGKIYPFQINGITALPDGSEYLVLSDPNRVKHLLERSPYLHYPFEVGQSINCRIDKINCNGKIYIEPLHPFYRIGKSYDFPLIRIERGKNGKGKDLAVFEDVFCNEIKLSLNHFTNSLQAGQVVKLKVSRIKKGLIYLAEPGFDEDFTEMEEGSEYPFVIKEFIDSPGKRSYFIITSPSGLKYKLRHKFYEKYGLTVGETIFCRLMRSGKESYLEPRHPLYVINSSYDFEIIGEDLIPDYPHGERKVLILKNDFGKNVLIPADKVNPEQCRNGKINCRIMAIRKGKLFLHCRK